MRRGPGFSRGMYRRPMRGRMVRPHYPYRPFFRPFWRPFSPMWSGCMLWWLMLPFGLIFGLMVLRLLLIGTG
jgi:hypothetical protein